MLYLFKIHVHLHQFIFNFVRININHILRLNLYNDSYLIMSNFMTYIML